MTVWTRFKDLVDRVAGHEKTARNFHEDELRLAAAALLVHASMIDGQFDASERRKLKALLQARFDLGDEEVRHLVQEAKVEESQSVDLFGFTNVLCRQLDQDGRKRIVEMLWEVVMADGVVHEFESNLVWRTAELLGVSTRDRVTLRQAVAARLGIRIND
ncbi:MAG: tellurite resistance TerB family protein [Methyloceanibacter sp.]